MRILVIALISASAFSEDIDSALAADECSSLESEECSLELRQLRVQRIAKTVSKHKAEDWGNASLSLKTTCSNGCGNEACDHCADNCAYSSSSTSDGVTTCECQSCPEESSSPSESSATCSNGCGNEKCDGCAESCSSSSTSTRSGVVTCACAGCSGDSSAPSPQASEEPSSPSDSTPTSDGSASDTNGILEEHNKYRCMHGVPPLSWSAALAQQAQQWADQQGGKMVHSHAPGVGENLYWSSGTPSPAAAVKSWYDEISLTDNGEVSAFSMGTGHYTQVVWRSTTEVGCGQSQGLLVCNYKPPGNRGGAFEANVNSPVKSASECR